MRVVMSRRSWRVVLSCVVGIDVVMLCLGVMRAA